MHLLGEKAKIAIVDSHVKVSLTVGELDGLASRNAAVSAKDGRLNALGGLVGLLIKGNRDRKSVGTFDEERLHSKGFGENGSLVRSTENSGLEQKQTREREESTSRQPGCNGTDTATASTPHLC